MPDNRSEQHISQKFVNNSWKDMSKLLDDKIPVQSPVSPLPTLILAALLFVASMAIVYLLLKQNQRIPAAELIKERVVYKPVYIDRYIHNTFGNAQSEQNSASPLSSAQSLENLPDINFTPAKYLLLNSASDIRPLSPTRFKFTSDNSENIVTTNPVSDTPWIAINDQTKIDFNNHHYPNLDQNIDPFSPKRRIQFNLGVLTFVANNFDYSGFGLSSGLQFPIGKNFSINSGVGVNFVSRDYLFVPFFQKDNNHQLLKSNEQAELDKEETYYSGLRSFNQIFIPLNIEYQFNNGLSLTSGIKFRYTYSETIDNVLKVQANRKLPLHENAESVFFSNTNVGVSAGIGYSINDKFTIHLDSEWGLNSIINKDRFKNPANTRYDLNLVNLSTHYTF